METDANRHRENIVNEDQETEIARLALENQRQRERRTNETNEEQLNRLARTKRKKTTIQTRSRRRIADAETEAERLERLGLVHIRARHARFNLPTYRVWYRRNRPVDPQDNQGAPDQVCPHCKAKYWRNEVNATGMYTKCCERNKFVIPRITQAHPTLVNYTIKDSVCKFGKQSKLRFTAFVCASMEGEKTKLVIIGKSEQHRNFREILKSNIQYFNNSTAWMTVEIFVKIVEDLYI
ncbi:unnamed protein product [Brachionus calyciflorus]|uniref:DDE-1 domain-containing protein n=1 Tax=Brachionus calyciflorus TaxID=104777 RepID=A0A814E4Y6_9BILA|nr:unnamed protein product [Brachionus calyciflorus]